MIGRPGAVRVAPGGSARRFQILEPAGWDI